MLEGSVVNVGLVGGAVFVGVVVVVGSSVHVTSGII